MRLFLFANLFFVLHFRAIASCDCPSADDCGPCQDGLINITLKYNGVSPATVTAKDNLHTYIDRIVNPGEDFVLEGALPNGKFVGSDLDIFINGDFHITIKVNCSASVFVNSTFGDFTVVAGASKEGGTLCCENSSTDIISPEISNCPTDIEVALPESGCLVSVNWTEPVASDNCNVKSFSHSHTPGTEFPSGNTTVTYTAVDDAGNTTICEFNVVVKDNIPPVLVQCPQDITVTSQEATSVTWHDPLATDNCGLLSLTSTHDSGSLFSVGTTTIEYIAVDISGNSSSCQFKVTITDDRELEIEQLVTPNGDGINDVWTLHNIDKYPDNEIAIADRWGNVVYSTSRYDNVKNAWDGKNMNGRAAPAGTYFYSIKLQTGSSRIERNGFIELLR